jgi:exo-beta-1,3-glucanase (GH17 family)
MRRCNLKTIATVVLSCFLFACGDEQLSGAVETDPGSGGNEVTELAPQPTPATFPVASNGDALLGNPDYLAISYGAWRTTVRESGAIVPSIDDHKEDMKILAAMGIKVLRTYNTQGFIGLDGKSNTENLLQAIKELKAADDTFEMYVLLGVWIDALNSWTDLDIVHDQENPGNALEIAKAKELALAYPDIVKVIAVGNEAMVAWAEYHVVPGIILGHVNDLQSWKQQSPDTADLWITSSDNFAVWAGDDANGNHREQADIKALIEAVDYISLHTYAHHDTHYDPTFKEAWKVPLSEQELSKEEQIASAMEKAYNRTLDQIVKGQTFVNSVDPTKPIHIGETGWSTVSSEMFGEGGTQAADEYKQKIFYDDMRELTNNFGASLFFFQAFDEPWKGDPNNPTHSEKHFGLIDIDGKVKYLAWDKVDTLNNLGLTRGDVSQFEASYGGDEITLLDTVLPPPFVIPVAPGEAGEFIVLSTGPFTGADAFGWEGTTWAGIDETTGILTVVPTVPAIKDWGWGAMVGDNNPRDLSDKSSIRFEIRGSTEQGNPLAEFVFGVGFQTDYGEWGSNYSVKFNDGNGYTLTEEWQTITIDIATDLPESVLQLDKVKNPLIVHHTSIDGNLTESDIQLRNISWFE